MLQAFTKRFCLLTVVMLLSVVNALAQDVIEIGTVDQLKTFRDAVNNGNNYSGKTVKLTANLDLSGENWTPIGNTTLYRTKGSSYAFSGVLDGDGHTISNLTCEDNTSDWACAGLFGNCANATIKNLTLQNVNIKSTHFAGAFVAQTYHAPTITNCRVIGGTITSTPEWLSTKYDNGDKVGGIVGHYESIGAHNISNCTVENVTISGYRDVGGIAGYIRSYVENCTVNNVTINQDNTHNYKGWTDNSDFNIGQIVGARSMEAATVNISGNETYNNTWNNVTINYGVIIPEVANVAKIGNVEYASLAEAIAAVPADGTETTITMLADAAANTGVTIAANQNIVLELNGKVISVTTNSTKSYALITNKGTLTINDNTDTNKDGTGTGKITTTATDPDGRDWPGYASNTITNNGTLIINSGYIENSTTNATAVYTVDNQTNGNLFTPTFTMNGGKLYNGCTDAIRQFLNSTTCLNKVVINGGVIASAKNGRIVVFQNSNAKLNKGELDITGGTILGNVGGWSAANNTYNFTDEQYGEISINISGGTMNAIVFADYMDNATLRAQAVVVTGGTYSVDPTAYVAEGYEAVNNGNGTWTVQKATYVAQIGDEKYASLAEAFAASGNIQADHDIKLLCNVTLTEALNLDLGVDEVRNLDLGGFTLTGRTNLKSGGLFVKNGIVSNPDGQPLNVYGSATPVEEGTTYSYLAIGNDVTINGAYGICVFGPTASSNAGYGAYVEMAGTINAHKGGIFVSGNLGQNIEGDMNNNVIIVGTINGNNSAGVALNGNATVDVYDGAVITGNTAIAIKRGVLNVNGGTITSTGAKNYPADPNYNGTEMTGAGISMTATYNNYGSMAVNISGGTITSANADALYKQEGTYSNAATFAVSGGTFSSDPTEFVATGYKAVDNGNGTWTVKGSGEEFANNVKDENNNVVATETVTVSEEGEATITKVEIAQEGVKNVTVSAAINNADVTEIEAGAFASLANNTTVQTIDLSSTQVALSGERSVNSVLKDIPATALVYLPSTSSVTGTNVVIKDENTEDYTCQSLLMEDLKDYSVPTAFTAETATLNRSFTADVPSTLCLPYDVPAGNITGKIYRFASIDLSACTITMTEETGGLKANVPYIFMPNAGTNSISASNIEVKMENPQTTQGTFTFVGVFEKKEFTADECSTGVYGYAGEAKDKYSVGQFAKGGVGAYVAGMRAYLIYTGGVSAAPGLNGAPAATSLPNRFNVQLQNANGETTEILNLDMETAEDGTPVYNLSGQRVNNAEKGIYIKNGKKVIIK